MKTTIITSVFAMLVSTMNLSAKNVITYSNVENNESGVKKEYVTINKETSKPESKGCYLYDRKGNITGKTISVWNGGKGWVNTAKYEYQYTSANKVSGLTYTEWNKETGNWADKSSFIAHIYDENDELLSLEQINIQNMANNDNNFITQK